MEYEKHMKTECLKKEQSNNNASSILHLIFKIALSTWKILRHK